MEGDRRRTRHCRIDRHLPRQARRQPAHAALPPGRRHPHARGRRVSEFCALNCEHVDLARRELRVLDANMPAGVRRVGIHDDLQEELAAYKAARGETWQAGEPAFLNARGKRWTRKRNRTACNPACTGRNQSPADRGRAPRHPRGGHPTHAAVHLHCLALRRGRRSGVRLPPRSGTKTSRQPTASTAASYSDASAARSADAASRRCASQSRTLDERGTRPGERESAELCLGTTDGYREGSVQRHRLRGVDRDRQCVPAVWTSAGGTTPSGVARAAGLAPK